MPTDTTLYAWARPLQVDNSLDHTWVTDYTPASTYSTINDVIAVDDNYWFCWGDFHDDDYRSIGGDKADLAVAKCLVTPNDSNAHGTIFRYAINGVCHQLANQVLHSSEGKIVVSQAHGYKISRFFYGTYGNERNAWNNQINKCASIGGEPMDKFEIELTQTLAGIAAPEKVEDLVSLRADFQAKIQDLGAKLSADNAEGGAAAINDLISEFMFRAHEILGDEGFKAVFDSEMRDYFGLVDPEMFAASEVAYAKRMKSESE